jgi:hypothetical protein
MSDASVVHIGENSPEHVAYQLLKLVAYLDGQDIGTATANAYASKPKADRKWLLDTYAECLRAVRDPDSRDS